MSDHGEMARAAAENAARRSFGKLVAFLSARTRDVAGAEDALSEAFAAALDAWPKTGVPANPEAWLLAVARRRAVDAVRRNATSRAGSEHLKLIAGEIEAMTNERHELPDERLRLMFACAHPAIDANVRAPLMLQTVLGFDAATIASAFLVPPATMSQRLVRAKTRIRDAGIPFRIPERSELGDRLDAVLEAIYATFAEGWTAPAGTETRRRNLAGEGIWLGRLIVELMPSEPEALGLLALMLFAEARRAARRDADGDYVPLALQDTGLWDDGLIDEAEAALLAASSLGQVGRYQLEAAVQSAHANRRRTGRTDWEAIVSLYDALLATSPSPVLTINRAVALAEAAGAAAGLAALDQVAGVARLADYQPYWAARAELLSRLDDAHGAGEAYDRAIGLEQDPAVRRFLQGQRSLLRPPH